MTPEELEALKANGYLSIREQGVAAMAALATLNPDGLRAGIAYLDEKKGGAHDRDTAVAMDLDRMRLEALIEVCEVRDRYAAAGQAKVDAHAAIATPGNGHGIPPFGRGGTPKR